MSHIFHRTFDVKEVRTEAARRDITNLSFRSSYSSASLWPEQQNKEREAKKVKKNQSCTP